jgi:arylsulfatase A-like enzyme
VTAAGDASGGGDSLGSVPWLVAFAVLFGGLAEMAVRLLASLTHPWPRASLYFDPQAVWMAPLVNLVLLLPPVLVVLALRRALGGQRAFLVIAGGAFTFAALEPLMLVPRLHQAALGIVALGIGVQAARWLTGAPGRMATLKRATLSLLMIAVLGTVRWNGALAVRARRVGAHPAGRTNVLLLVLDTVRAMQLHIFGYPRHTSPGMDSLAARGVRFAAAFSTAPWTLASHATMFTGHYGHELSVSWVDGLDHRYPTLAEHFAGLGYATGGFSANIEYASRHFGLARGFGRFEDRMISVPDAIATSSLGAWLRSQLPQALRSHLTSRKTAAQVNDEFLRWQAGLNGQPFFAFLNYYDAHAPYDPPAPYDRIFLPQPPRSREIWPGPPFPKEVLNDITAAYDGGVAYVDHQLGLLLAELNRRHALDSTIVIVVGDHGEEFGEHDLIGHGFDVNNPVINVPLIVAAPGIPAGVAVTPPVSLRDLGATLLDLAGSPGRAAFPGHSLRALWERGADPAASPVLSEVDWADHVPANVPLARGDMASLVRGQWHVIRRGDGAITLFDRVADPLEQHDLAAVATLADTLHFLTAALQAARSQGTPIPRPHR